MRLTTLPFFLTLSFIPAVLSSPAVATVTQAPRAEASLAALGIDENSPLTATILGGGTWPPPNPYPQCQGDPTRYDDTCQCHEGFVQPVYPWDTCCCGDQKNTLLVIEGCAKHGCNQAVCLCKAKHSWYHIRDKKCVCDRGYVASYGKGGKLKCSPPGTSVPPGNPSQLAKKRDLKDVIDHRLYDTFDSEDASGALEGFMSCKVNERACEVDGAWTCTDVMSDLNACGACKGEANADCATLPGVDGVRCDAGRCGIDSCAHGFTLKTLDSHDNSTSPQQACEPKEAKSSWLKIQV